MGLVEPAAPSRRGLERPRYRAELGVADNGAEACTRSATEDFIHPLLAKGTAVGDQIFGGAIVSAVYSRVDALPLDASGPVR